MKLSKIGPKFRKKRYTKKPTKINVDELDQSKLWWKDFVRIFTTLFFLYFKARYLILTKVCCRAFFLSKIPDQIGLLKMVECVIAEIFFHSGSIWLKYLTWKRRYLDDLACNLSAVLDFWGSNYIAASFVVFGHLKWKKIFLDLTLVRQKSGLQQGMFLKV